MRARAIHRCIHVLDLEKSLEFYEKALGLKVVRRMGPEDHSWENVFIANEETGFQLELTWNDGRVEPYNNGNRDTHMCYAVDNYEEVRKLHEEMGVICFDNTRMGLYFIEDPDGCWIEVVHNGRSNNHEQVGVDVLNAIRNRRSIRKYTGEPIPEAKLEKVIEAGLLAPAGRAKRPWELIVVQDKEMLAKLSEMRIEGSAKMLAGAEAAIVVIANPEVDTWVEDCSLVMGNMYNEASSLGLGCCWIQGRMRMHNENQTTNDYVKDLLGIPEEYELEATMSLGMPAETKESCFLNAKLKTKVHRERFEAPGKTCF